MKNKMDNKENSFKFKAVDADGRQIDCETLFMFDSPETQKSYIVYTDNSIDEEGNTRVYASIYNPEDLKVDKDNNVAALKLIAIETEKEWKIIETILATMQEEATAE